MKTNHLFILLSVFCLVVMILVDYIIGSKAEFINAYTVIQRLIGQQSTVAESLVARKLGVTGEFISVIVVNIMLGGIITTIVRFFRNK